MTALAHIEQDRHCLRCGALLIRKRHPGGSMERPSAFAERIFCSHWCANRARLDGVNTSVARFPTPPGAFARGYERALAAGLDLLELGDAANECATCGRLPGECECKDGS